MSERVVRAQTLEAKVTTATLICCQISEILEHLVIKWVQLATMVMQKVRAAGES